MEEYSFIISYRAKMLKRKTKIHKTQMKSFNLKPNILTKILLTCFYTSSYPLASIGGNFQVQIL